MGSLRGSGAKVREPSECGLGWCVRSAGALIFQMRVHVVQAEVKFFLEEGLFPIITIGFWGRE